MMQTYLKALNIKHVCQAYSVECVSISSIILYAIYGTVCFQLIHFSCHDCENNHIIFIKWYVWVISYRLGLGHETMICTVSLAIFSWWIYSRCNEYILVNPYTLSTSSTTRVDNWKVSLGLYSLSGRTSYGKISRSLEAARFGFKLVPSLWNLTGTSAAPLPYDHYNTQSRGFETSRDLEVRRLTA